ncbi:hypothetical protein HOT31_gp100 [Microbacterium phage Hendrix]|uniref:Uncharacterized protein n=1 Tax=Microbacterium phage Hendrix TaxID=2182341 RepID=A0A2U8UU99_9CAUD|nr:hypothetical protein HOT31_gp100 [Microbacterium phage Hendrix]AWN07771.1 hypothetical protein PBI_HENDRIX_100 [Microbacterium phage Hendrix]
MALHPNPATPALNVLEARREEIGQGWELVGEAVQTAKAIVTDGCHKIYLAMSEEEIDWFRECGYGNDNDASKLVLLTDENRGEAVSILRSWFDSSCGLEFVTAVEGSVKVHNDGFLGLIEQFHFAQDDDDNDDSEES